MAHPFQCKACHRTRRCTIAGCLGDCTRVCLVCVRTLSKEQLRRILGLPDPSEVKNEPTS